MSTSACGEAACEAVKNPEYLVINGITTSGTRFRPSDWAQRLAGNAGCLNVDGRFRFHSLAQVAHLNGCNALIIDKKLEQNDPELYRFFLKFAIDNDLERFT